MPHTNKKTCTINVQVLISKGVEIGDLWFITPTPTAVAHQHSLPISLDEALADAVSITSR